MNDPLVGQACDDGAIYTGPDVCDVLGSCTGSDITNCCVDDAACAPTLCGREFCNSSNRCDEDPVVCEAQDLCIVSACAPDSGLCVDSAVVCPDGESCDPDDGACKPDAPASKTVFVTRAVFQGNLLRDSDDAADNICQEAAETAGLSGTYLAWLSSRQNGPPNASFNRSVVPYVRTDGEPVANDYADLIRFKAPNPGVFLTNPIDKDEFGAQVSGEVRVWTGVESTGEDNLGVKCSESAGDWHSAGGGGNGSYGLWSQVSRSWTNFNSFNCSGSSHLYCFEQ